MHCNMCSTGIELQCVPAIRFLSIIEIMNKKGTTIPLNLLVDLFKKVMMRVCRAVKQVERERNDTATV